MEPLIKWLPSAGTTLFCVFKPGNGQAFFASTLIKTPINKAPKLFAFSPVCLSNMKHIFVTQLFESGCFLHDSCLVVWSSRDEESERAEKSKWEIFWDDLGATITFSHVSILGMALSQLEHLYDFCAQGMSLAVVLLSEGLKSRTPRLLCLSYTGIKIHPQSSNLIFFNFFSLVFLWRVAVVRLL